MLGLRRASSKTGARMFSTLGLFSGVLCPEFASCKRSPCPFSHVKGAVRTVMSEAVAPVTTSAAPPPLGTTHLSSVVPAKRPALEHSATSSGGLAPPRKVARTDASTSASAPTSVVPTLNASIQTSKVAVVVRQAMLNQFYQAFRTVYAPILERHPQLPSEHAMLQELEVHNKTNQITYRNACISALAALKKRPPPDSSRHPSVGTEGQLSEHRANHDALSHLQLAKELLEPLILTTEEQAALGYVTVVPEEWGPGALAPHASNTQATCDRCKGEYVVKEDFDDTACKHHWGRTYYKMLGGEKNQYYTCCSEVAPGPPCAIGPHVLYETDPATLHSRHAYSPTEADETGASLEMAALDCEMIYTTAGMTLARVSIVDHEGKTVFDELVKPDPGVTVVDFNTRFSGVENLDAALLDLVGVREALKSYISSNTIIIGHALDNDLRALRMIHGRCIDTVHLFPHQSGLPFRRALRLLTKAHLGREIQTAGAKGHSSVEDSVAALDLVKYHLLQKRTAKKSI